MKPHKHAELIKAWADGQVEVEYRYPKDDGSWSLWKDLSQCVFHDWYEYRIKPEPKPDVPEGLIDPKSYYIGYEDGKKAPQIKPLEKTDVYSLALESGFMLSTQHGQGENKLMPVTDGDTLMALVKAIEERHGIK